MNFIPHRKGFWSGVEEVGRARINQVGDEFQVVFCDSPPDSNVAINWRGRTVTTSPDVNLWETILSGGSFYFISRNDYVGLIDGDQVVRVCDTIFSPGLITVQDSSQSVIVSEARELRLYTNNKVVSRASLPSFMTWLNGDCQNGLLVIVNGSGSRNLYAGRLSVDREIELTNVGSCRSPTVKFVDDRRAAVIHEALGVKPAILIDVLDATDGRHVRSHRFDLDYLAAASPGNGRLVVLGRDGLLQVSEGDTRRLELPEELGEPMDVCLSPDRLVANVLTDRGIVRIDLDG